MSDRHDPEMREPSDQEILTRDDTPPADVDFRPLHWDTDFTDSERLALIYAGLSINDINSYRAAGIDNYQAMHRYQRASYTGPTIIVYCSLGCGANEGLLLHSKGVTPKAWATYRADNPDISPAEAVALKAANIGKQMFTELRAYGVTDPDQMIAIAKQFTGKELATWRRQGLTIADLYNEDGKLSTPHPIRLALTRQYGLDPRLADRLATFLGDDIKLTARVVDRAVALAGDDDTISKNARYTLRGWAESDAPIELAARALAVAADYTDTLAAAATLAGDNTIERIIATIERRPGERDTNPKTIMLTIVEFSGVRPLTDSELDDAALLADHQPHHRYDRIIATVPGAQANPGGFRRPQFDPTSMTALAATARATGNPALFLSNLNDYQRARSMSEPIVNVIERAAVAARIGRTKSEMDRAKQAGAKTVGDVERIYRELDTAAAGLGFDSEPLGPTKTARIRI